MSREEFEAKLRTELHPMQILAFDEAYRPANHGVGIEYMGRRTGFRYAEMTNDTIDMVVAGARQFFGLDKPESQ